MSQANQQQAELVMHYVEGWLSNDYPDAAKYLRDHAAEIAGQMVEDGCADPAPPTPDATEGSGEVLSEARLVVGLAEHWCAALHPPAPQTDPTAADPRHRVAACFACQRTAARVVEDWLAARLAEPEHYIRQLTASRDAAERQAEAVAARLTSLTSEVEALRRWKAEASALFDGMQDLGRALGIPLGVVVTGPDAVAAARALSARAEAAEAGSSGEADG